MLVLYNLLVAVLAAGVAWLLVWLRHKSMPFLCIALAVLISIPVVFMYSHVKYESDPHGSFGTIAGITWFVTVIGLMFTALSSLRNRRALQVLFGILLYAVGFLIALTIGMNVGLFEK